jgi:hypothetical protein
MFIVAPDSVNDDLQSARLVYDALYRCFGEVWSLYLQRNPSIQVPQFRSSNLLQFSTVHLILRVFRYTGSLFYLASIICHFLIIQHLLLSVNHLCAPYWTAHVMPASLVAMRNLLEECMFLYHTYAKYSLYKKLILWTGIFMWCMLDK